MLNSNISTAEFNYHYGILSPIVVHAILSLYLSYSKIPPEASYHYIIIDNKKFKMPTTTAASSMIVWCVWGFAVFWAGSLS